jgi:two-component system cell cycle response regulator
MSRTSIETYETMQLDRSAVAKQIGSVTPKKACFVVMGGMDVGRVIVLDEPVITIGRDAQCAVVLQDDGVSQLHVEVRREATDSVIVRDLGSTNGTFIGGERIVEAKLHDGTKVLIGRRTILNFTFLDELEYNFQQQMYEISTRDGLTGFYNRRYFSLRIITDLSFARRLQIPCTLVIFDIDHFKKVNDTHGHRTGDQVLITVTEAVGNVIRKEDILARYGGEEFVVIAQGTDLVGGKALGERIQLCVAGQRIPALDDPNTVIKITVSIGVATVTSDASVEVDELISTADANLYHAKRHGRNQVVTSPVPPMSDK